MLCWSFHVARRGESQGGLGGQSQYQSVPFVTSQSVVCFSTNFLTNEATIEVECFLNIITAKFIVGTETKRLLQSPSKVNFA